MGPGRWGSRGDIKLGVNVSYSDIHNTALLVEIARKHGSYVPELSFGTHFFQDLVESSINYLPLYPDDEATDFNWTFLRSGPNMLAHLLPEYAHLEHTIRVIDVPGETDGRILRVLMNGELDRAMGLLAAPAACTHASASLGEAAAPEQAEHWQWRLRMAERLAADMDMEALGVEAIYVFGSTKNASAAAGSDIDLLLHVGEGIGEGRELRLWLDGWSRCLAEINYMRTGYRVEGMLDVHFVTDQDIARRTSFASKIGAATDAARLLRSR
ncbi:MAG: pyruvate, phosphate dikinase, partial [Myxococcota bacterium]